MTPDSILDQFEKLLPPHVRAKLRSCPKRPVTGVHQWLAGMAASLTYHLGEQDCIADLLQKYSADCGRPVEDSEIWEAIHSASAFLNKRRGAGARGAQAPSALREHRDSPKWPKPDPAYIQAVVSQGPTLAQLEANSPVRWTDGMPHAEEVVSTLFEKDELICVGKTKTYFETGPVSTWVRLIVLRQMQFIVPSPMRAWRGSTKKGELSARSLENTGPRCFLVCEFDQGTLDEHAALLAHLANYAPLVMAVHSGNKSVHGWFNCRGSSPDKVASFFGYAVRLGADPATWTSCQFVRMPDGLRDSGQRQRIIYFNPSILKAV